MFKKYLKSLTIDDFNNIIYNALCSGHPDLFLKIGDKHLFDKIPFSYEMVNKIYEKLKVNKYNCKFVTELNDLEIENKKGYVNTFLYLIKIYSSNKYFVVFKYFDLNDVKDFYLHECCDSIRQYNKHSLKPNILSFKTNIHYAKQFTNFVKKEKNDKLFLNYYMKKNNFIKNIRKNDVVYLFGHNYQNIDKGCKYNMIHNGYITKVEISKRRKNILHIKNTNICYEKNDEKKCYFAISNSCKLNGYPYICCITKDKTLTGRQFINFPLEHKTIDYYKHIKKETFFTLMAIKKLNKDIVKYIVIVFL